MSQYPLQFIVGGIIISTYTTNTMRKATGQMQELTQEKLDDYNTLYCWEYNDMCDFIENHSEEEFREHYETYNRLVDDYGQNLVDEFIENYDVSTLENFEDMYQGQYDRGGAGFAEQLAIDCGMVSTGISWVEIDWEKSWDNLSYDYTEIGNGYIFCDNY